MLISRSKLMKYLASVKVFITI